MSGIKELAWDIEQLYIDGHSPRMISIMLECPIEQVYGWLEEVGLDAEDYSPHATINS